MYISLNTRNKIRMSVFTIYFLIKFIYFLIEGQLLYRIVLVSAKHQHESAIGIHMSPPS